MSARDTALDAIARGAIASQDMQAALASVEGVTSRGDWLRLVKIFLLAGGLLSIAFGIGFFIAFNWAELGRIGKFVLVLVALFAATGVHAIARPASVLSSASQVVVVFLIGTLLALSGQIYQTGADTWQLFAAWAALALPFALITRSFWVWVGWLLVADIAACLFAASLRFSLFWVWIDEQSVYWALGILNALFAVIVSLQPALVQQARLRPALIQLAVITLGACATLLAINTIIVGEAHALPGFAAWLVTLSIIYINYRVRALDLIVMSGFALSMLAVAVALFIRLIGEVFGNLEWGAFLLIALVILGLATYAGRWLYRLQQLSESQS